MLNLLPHSTLSSVPHSAALLASFQELTQSSRKERQNHHAPAIIVAIALATSLPAARAGPVTSIGSSGQAVPTQAVELDETARSIVEVELAIKNFEHLEFDQCIQRLAKARAAHPELPPPGALFAKLAFLGNQQSLIRPALERAIAEDAKHPEVFILFGNLALAEGRLTDAAVHFEKAMSLAASPRWTVEQRDRFGLLCNQGNALVAENRRDWEEARDKLEAWLRAEPSHALARQRLGKALFGLGEFDAAYEALQKATAADPKLEPAAVSMGWLFTRSGNVKKAGEWMEFSARSAPESLPVQLAVAAWLLEQGRGDEAQSHVDVAAKLDPKSIEVKRVIGLAARERKDLARAERIFQSLADDAPADSWARNQLSLVLADQNDAAKQRRALELAELSVKQNANDAAALATLGTVYYRLDRLEQAEKVLHAVVASGKASSDVAYVLARVKAARGQQDAAGPLLQIALKAPGFFIGRKDAQEWLDRLTATAK